LFQSSEIDFGSDAEMVPKDLSEKGLKSLTGQYHVAYDIVGLVAAGFAVRDGSLVAHCPVVATLFVSSWAETFVKILIVDALPHTLCLSWKSAEKLSIMSLLEEAANFKLASEGRILEGVWCATCTMMSSEAKEDLVSCMFAHASLQMMLVTLTSDLTKIVSMLNYVVAMGIDDVRIYKLRINMVGFLSLQAENLFAEKEGDESTLHSRYLDTMLADSNAILQRNPSDLDALYTKAFALRSKPFQTQRFRLARDTYDEFLKLAEKDDRHRPAANYHAGATSCVIHIENPTSQVEMPIDNGSRKKFNGQQKKIQGQQKPMNDKDSNLSLKYYNQGLQAELLRLPFFSPVGPIDSKEMLALYCAARKKR